MNNDNLTYPVLHFVEFFEQVRWGVTDIGNTLLIVAY